MTFAEYLRTEGVRTAPTPDHMGLFTGGSGAPGAATSPFFFFYVDTDTDDVYFNSDRTLAGWTLALPGTALSAGGAVLTATI